MKFYDDEEDDEDEEKEDKDILSGDDIENQDDWEIWQRML